MLEGLATTAPIAFPGNIWAFGINVEVIRQTMSRKVALVFNEEVAAIPPGLNDQLRHVVIVAQETAILI